MHLISLRAVAFATIAAASPDSNSNFDSCSTNGNTNPNGNGSVNANSGCKAYPGSSNWPSQQSWNRFNVTVNGRLIDPKPPASVCHVKHGGYNAEKCSQLREAYHTFEFLVQDPVALNAQQFTNDTCLFDPKAPCTARGYPAYVVNATDATLVKQAIDFARERNIRVNVRSTGHDFLGRSNAPGSLSVWVHHLKDIDYHAGQFKLASGRVHRGDAVSVGGGVEMNETYIALDKYNQTIVGGYGGTVSVGGYITGAGHSILSPKYGLAADNVLEMQVVTPNGDILMVNQDQHPDLFWAILGGGGSTFGIVTKYTMKTHPSPKMLAIKLSIMTSPEDPHGRNVTEYVLSQTPYMMDKGIYGYGRIVRNQNGKSGASGDFAMLDSDLADFEQAMKPIFRTIKSRWPHIKPDYNTTQYPSFLEWFKVVHDMESAGVSEWVVSRLLDRDVLVNKSKQLISIFWDLADQLPLVSYFPLAGKGVQNAKPPGGSNAVNPAWRSAEVHSIIVVPFEHGNKTAEAVAAKTANDMWQPIRDLTPGSGSYVNEAFPYEEHWQKVFWGSHYDRLLSLKRKVDPHDVFVCFPCVGSEGWKQNPNGTLCRV